MKGILMFFENVAAQQPFSHNTEAFCNLKIMKVEVTIGGTPNQLSSRGESMYQIWDKVRKYLAHHLAVSVIMKWQQLQRT